MADSGEARSGAARFPDVVSTQSDSFAPSSGVFFFKQKTAYEILSGLVGSEMCIRDSVLEISKFEGDASVNTRKGNKKFAVFDLSVTCKWEGEVEGAEGVVKGEIRLTEFASTNDEDEYEWTVTASDGDAAAKEKFKQKIKSSVAASFAPHLATFVRELSEM